MAFHKLFCVLHRRTDWFRLLRWEKEIMMPDWNQKMERRSEMAMQRLVMPFGICKNMLEENTAFI